MRYARATTTAATIFATAVLALIATAPARAAETVAEPPDYRMDDFRSPVPATLKGAKVVHIKDVEALWKSKGAAFIDVLPRLPKPKNLPAGTVWHDKVRENIPGSLWLANVGFGGLAPQMDAYFRDGLKKATGGDMNMPVLFYCLSNCWMSWNAAKRALTYGYTHVLWFPDGSDGWAKAGLPVIKAEPEPLPDLPDAPPP